MIIALEGTFVFYSFVGAIILIVMSSLAGAALRSTKSQVKTHTHKQNNFHRHYRDAKPKRSCNMTYIQSSEASASLLSPLFRPLL